MLEPQSKQHDTTKPTGWCNSSRLLILFQLPNVKGLMLLTAGHSSLAPLPVVSDDARPMRLGENVLPFLVGLMFWNEEIAPNNPKNPSLTGPLFSEVKYRHGFHTWMVF